MVELMAPDLGLTLAPASERASGRMNERQLAHFADLADRYTRRTANSKRLAQRYRRQLADPRAVVGFSSATKELLYPIAARQARGAHLSDVDGNTYVDVTMGFGTLMFGHEPPFLTDAVSAYLADGMRLGPRGEETGQAAELLCELTGLDRVTFVSSGTEANSGAFRIARAFTGRTMIVTFDGSYHGHFDPVLGRPAPDGAAPRTVPISAGIPDSAVSETLVLRYGDEASLEVIRRHADRIAVVVVEPVPSRHPYRQPVEFVRALRELCDERGIVLMFDEMLTGFRPHPQGAQGVFGVQADLATYGKVIGGGYPIGAIAGRADIMDWIDGGFWQYGDDSMPRGDAIFFAGTYIHHPVSMVAARAVLTWLRDQGPGLQQQLNARTDRFASALNDFLTAEEFPVRVQHFGSLFRLAHQGDLELLYKHMILEGVHVWARRNLFLSTAHTDADVDFVIDAIRNSLSDLRKGGFLPRPRGPEPGAAPA
jgi:iturin family lipopeptide synthetase A